MSVLFDCVSQNKNGKQKPPAQKKKQQQPSSRPKKVDATKVQLKTSPDTNARQYLGYAGHRGALLRGTKSYMDMLLSPHRSIDEVRDCRYPDETIVPTAVVSLQDSTTWTQVDRPNPATQPSNFFVTALRWKACIDNGQYNGNANPIMKPQIASLNPPDYINTWFQYQQQAPWSSGSSIDRTLALGIRARLVGLPTNTFMPSGTLYFLQYQNTEFVDLINGLTLDEGAARAAVTAKKGFSMTVREMANTSGVTIPYLPQGPMSFVFSDTTSEQAVFAGEASTGGINFPQAGVVSANGGVLIVGYGIQTGSTFKFDYGHIIEYVPKANLAGLISTSVQPPSAAGRDAIISGVASVQQAIGGKTALDMIRPFVSDGLERASTWAANTAINVASGAAMGFLSGGPAGAGMGATYGLASSIPRLPNSGRQAPLLLGN